MICDITCKTSLESVTIHQVGMIIRWLRMRNALKTPDASEMQQHEQQRQDQAQQEQQQQHADDEREVASLLQPSSGV